MQNIAFIAAIFLLGTGGLLNLIVVAFLTARVVKRLRPDKVKRSGRTPTNFAAAHR